MFPVSAEKAGADSVKAFTKIFSPMKVTGTAMPFDTGPYSLLPHLVKQMLPMMPNEWRLGMTNDRIFVRWKEVARVHRHRMDFVKRNIVGGILHILQSHVSERVFVES